MELESYWPEEKRMLQQTVRNFMKRECPREFVRDLDENPRHPKELVDKAAGLGLTGIRIPTEYGGLGGDLFDLTVAHEEMSRVSLAVSNAVGVSGSWGAHKVAEFGTKEQKQEILPRIVRGELVFSVATTEAGGGSDVLGGMRTNARLDNGGFVINGEKMFISAAHIADYIIVTCITDPKTRRVDGLSQIIVEPKKIASGLEIRPIPKVSIKASGYNMISFDNVSVPRENLLGELNQGWRQLVHGHSRHNLIGSAQALGLAWAAYQDAMQYAQQRQAFGRPIGQFQTIQRYLSEMASEIDIARNYMYHTARIAAEGHDYTMEGLMLNKFSSEVAFKTVNNAMSIYGAYGLTMEFDVQRYYRDVRHFLTTPYPNEMIINRIAMGLGLPKSY